MLILALDTSGRTASCALCRDGKVLASETRDSMMDHSRTLLPVCEDLLKHNGLQLSDIDAFAAVVGPGSFTGVRIGTAAVKGFSWALGKPCAGVSSLLAMAYGAKEDGVLCTAVDARPGEHYYALFSRENGRVTRLTEDRPAPDEEMRADMTAHGCTHLLCDAQDAAGAAIAAFIFAKDGRLLSCHKLAPVYLKIPQAERLRKEKNV